MPDVFPDHSLAQVETYLNGAADTLNSFVARANVSVSSPKQNLRFGSVIDHRKGDSLYMNVKVTLGIEAARALVTPDSFFVYDRLKKKLYFGDISRAGEVFPFPLDGDDLFETLLGLPAANPADSWVLSSDSEHYQLKSATTRRTLTIDPRVWRVTEYTEHDKDGRLVEKRSYSEFASFDGVILPRRFVMSRPVDNTTASVFYRAVNLNPSKLAFNLDYSDRAERIHVR